MNKLVIKYSGGLIKEPETADHFLLGFSIVALSISMSLIFSMEQGPYIPLPPGTKIVYQPNEPPRLKLIASVISN